MLQRSLVQQVLGVVQNRFTSLMLLLWTQYVDILVLVQGLVLDLVELFIAEIAHPVDRLLTYCFVCVKLASGLLIYLLIFEKARVALFVLIVLAVAEEMDVFFDFFLDVSDLLLAVALGIRVELFSAFLEVVCHCCFGAFRYDFLHPALCICTRYVSLANEEAHDVHKLGFRVSDQVFKSDE